jgi:hypothetical protein
LLHEKGVSSVSCGACTTYIKRLPVPNHLILHLLRQLLEEPTLPSALSLAHRHVNNSLKVEIPVRNDRAPARRHPGLCSTDTLNTGLECLCGAFCGLRETVDARAEGSDGVEVDLHALFPYCESER